MINKKYKTGKIYLKLKSIIDKSSKQHFEKVLNRDIEFKNKSFKELDKYIDKKAKEGRVHP